MAKGNDIINGIVEAFQKAKPIFIGVGGAILVYIVLLIVMGVFNNQVQTGTISVDAQTKTAVTGAVGNFTQIGVAILNALNSTTGFIVIGVIFILVAWLIGKDLTSGSSRRKGRRY